MSALTHPNDDWHKLSKEKQQEVLTLHDGMKKHLVAETEAFYTKHPELKLSWSLSCDVSIRVIPKYRIGDTVECKAEGISFSGVIQQYTSDLGAVIYHVDATVLGAGLIPLFVEEKEIIGLTNARA